MKIKRIFALCSMIMAFTILTGCSGNTVSAEAKKLYNEQIEIYKKKADFLDKCLSKDEPTTGMSFAYPTSFFHLNAEEKEVYEKADFGEEMTKNLKKGEEIEKDADKLYDAFPNNSFNVTESDIDNLNGVFKELKEKYQGYDYSMKMYE